MLKIRKEYLSALWSGGSGVLFSLVIAILSANVLTVSERGELQSFVVISMLLSTVVCLGVPYSNAYFSTKKMHYLPDSFFFPFYTLIVSLAAIFLYSEMTWIGILFIIFFAFFFYFSERSKSAEMLHIYSKVVAIQPLFCFIFSCIFIQILQPRDGIFWGYILSYIIAGMTLLFYGFKDRAQSQSFDINKIDLKYVAGYWLSLLSSMLAANIDKLYILAVLTMADLGVFAVIQSVSAILGRVADRFATTYFVLSSSEGLSDIRNKIFLMTASFIPIAFLFGWMIGEYVLEIIFSNKYSGYSIESGVVFVSALIASASWILAQQANSSGRPHLNIFRNAISSFIFLMLAYSEVFGIGLIGICYSVLVASISRFIYSYTFAR